MKKKKGKFGFTLIELMATLIIIVVVLAISIPLISNLIEIVKREAFRATAYSIVDSGRFLLASSKATNEEFYYRDGVQYNADNKKLDYSGKGPETGTVILNEKGSTVAIAIHNGTYCATKSADEKKVTITKTTPDDCNAYTIIKTCDTWEEIALKYDVTLSSLLKLNNETDSNSSTCGRDIKIPVSSTSSDSVVAGGGPTVYYKTYYTVGYVGYSNPYPGTNYEYTIELGVLPIAAKDIDAVRVVAHSVFEDLDDFKRYIVKKNMREVIWPGEEPSQIDINQAGVFKDHAATSSNMVSDDVSVECDNETCYATIDATVNNLNSVNPNTINGYEVAYTPIKFTVEFNGEAALCTVRTSQDTAPGTLAGTGTSADPYLVESIEDLVALSNNVNSGNTYSGKYISLTNTFDFKNQKSYKNYQTTVFGDINGNGTVEGLMTELTTGAGFKPIGSSTTKFSGKLLGNSGCVFDLYINRPTTAYVGLIGYNTGGTITALTLMDINVTGGDYTGGVAGYNENGYITDIGINGNVTGKNYVGMAAGKFYSDGGSYKVTSIMSEGNVTGVNDVGGLVGYVYMYYHGGSISGVNKGGSITATGTNVGRIVGLNENWYDGSINLSALALASTTINGSTVTSTSNTSNNGANITNISEINNINLADLAIDTYIGGDNDGNGYYWDYDARGNIVRTSIAQEPLAFNLAGSGTSANPYLISSYDDLRQASLKPGSVYKLISNIDLTNKRFYMLGSYSNPFTGTIIGDEKAISNLTINSPNAPYIGLIGYNNGGTVKDLNLDNVNINASNCVGALTGYNNSGNLINNIVEGSITGVNNVGLAAGYYYAYNPSQITSIIAEGDVTGANNVGGLVGYAYDAHADNTIISYIRGIYQGGSITATGTSVGRIVGATGKYNYNYPSVSSLAIKSATINGSTVTSTYPTTNNGADITSMSDINNINLAEAALDTYIGGDNDSDGFYWDYDGSNVVLKRVADYPLTFSLAGSGTSANPYLISSYDDLRQASLKPNSVYKLTSNIDLTNKRFYMLGSYTNPFTGTIIGDEKTISNLAINSPYASYIGLIGYNNGGTVKDLNLDNININASNYTGFLAGYNNNGNILNDAVNGSLVGNNYVGMAAGYFYAYNPSQITSIIAEGDVTGTNNVGGLVGYAYDAHADNTIISYIRGIYKGGSITATGTSVGRIAGAIGKYNYNYPSISSLAMKSSTINSATVTSTYPTANNGADITSMSDINNINLAEAALDTYIGGDNDGDGFYWDYDNSNAVLKRVVDYPLTFSLAGSGTSADPYLISSYTDLRQASLKPGSVYKFTSNIDLTGKNYYMLGSYTNPFTGIIIGDEKVISNLAINSPHASYIGLIGYNNGGTVKDLNLDNININASNYTGFLTGYNNNGNIFNDAVNGSLVGNNYVGMAAGYFYAYNPSQITSIIAEGDVTGTNNVGGLVGYAYDAHAANTFISYIRGIYKGGSVTATGTSVGRIVGALGRYNYNYPSVSSLAIKSSTINGSTVTSTYPTANNGADITSMSDINNINLAEAALDTYIGGDNDGDGFYWDYDSSNIVLKRVVDYPLTFSLAGSGTSADSYLISSYDDLRQASLKPGSVYKFTSNIDLTGKNYYMIGSYANQFTGTINGNGKVISNLTINSPRASYIGLVGYSRGTIAGLALNNIYISGSNYIGGFAGYINDKSIIDCIVDGTINGNNYLGMATGYYYAYNPSQVASVTAEGDIAGKNYVGGIVGYAYDAHASNTIIGYIKGVYKGGSIAASDIGASVGRIVGGLGKYNYNPVSVNASALSSSTINGATVTSSSSSSNNGLDITSLDLSNSSTYTNRGFNFTDEALDYIWYIDGGVANFRPGSL